MAEPIIFKLSEVVKLRKADMKDKKKQSKLEQIVKFAFHQVVLDYELELRKGKENTIYDFVKEADFRTQFMLNIEAQLAAGGMGQYNAILGNNVSLEIKISRKSLLIFDIGKHF